MTGTCRPYYTPPGMDAIIAALDGEIAAVRNAMKHVTERHGSTGPVVTGTLNGRPVVTARAGVGKVMAAMCTQEIISNYQPGRIIVLGIAGALSSELAVGDTVLGEGLMQYDMDASALGFAVGEVPYTPYRVLHSDPDMLATAELVPSALGRVLRGRILSGDRFLTQANTATLEFLRTELGGDAVEMEGAAAALVASVHRIPFLVMRTISDHVADKPRIKLDRFLAEVSQNNLRFVAALLNPPL